MDEATRKRGRPRLAVTGDVLLHRRLLKQRHNARHRSLQGDGLCGSSYDNSTSKFNTEGASQQVSSCIGYPTDETLGSGARNATSSIPESIPCENSCGKPPSKEIHQIMDQPTRKRGRPRLVVTEDVVERRRLSKQDQNARRSGLHDSVPYEDSCVNGSAEVMHEPTTNLWRAGQNMIGSGATDNGGSIDEGASGGDCLGGGGPLNESSGAGPTNTGASVTEGTSQGDSSPSLNQASVVGPGDTRAAIQATGETRR